MRQATGTLTITALRPGLHEITGHVQAWLGRQGFGEGLLTLFVRHTSASLLIQENAAPAAGRDLERFFARVAPEGDRYEHDDEGPDDMPAHLRAALTQVQCSTGPSRPPRPSIAGARRSRSRSTSRRVCLRTVTW